MYQISAGYFLRGLVTALVMGAVLGGLWGMLIPFGMTFFLGLLLGLGVGYAVGEAVSVATNRKVGQPLQVLAAGGVIVAYLVRSALLASALRNVAVMDIVTNDVFGLVVVLLGIVVAVSRLR